MKVLIVKLTSFGDVVHTFPAVTDLAAARPGVEIDWLVDESFAPFVALHPAVTTVHSLAQRRLRARPTNWPRLVGESARLGRALRRRRYDHVVDMQGLMKSALPALLAGRGVAGLDAASARESAASRLYARRIGVPRAMHAVERSRRLLATAVGYPVPAGQGRYGLSVSKGGAQRFGVEAPYAVAIHSASWETKLWPERNWRALLTEMTAGGRAVVLPWGSPNEMARAQRLAVDIAGVHVLPEVLSGDALTSVIAGADLAVGLDSGLMHLAAALDVPGVWMFGPTDPGLTGPYGRAQTVIASTYPEAPCRRKTCDREARGHCCMEAIGVDEVRDAIAATVTPA
ncbi:lipopolysaccharide heptosyltransferase I [Bauldia sp.]|uniref:lipopolysaccharide heptosyltransferase I n=1 Tax=Bauldia sp. TaxID=2575872 RepID=UPI003BA9AE81